MPADPYKYFRIEAKEILGQLGEAVLALERGAAAETLMPKTLRLLHTLKGAARVVRHRALAEASHALEDVLVPLRQTTGPLAPTTVARVLEAVDEMEAEVERLWQGIGAAPASAVAPSPAEVASPAPKSPALPSQHLVVRADAGDVERLLEAVGEASARVAHLQRLAADAEQVRRLAEGLGAGAVPDALRSALGRLERELTRGVEAAHREVADVRTAAEHLRLVPARVIFGPLERATRDAADELGREVTFSASGEVRLDPEVLTAAQAALVQAVRNAVAHGIEAPGERRAAGKPAAGTVTLRLGRDGDRVTFTLSDDGRGLDGDAIVRRARERGIFTPGDEVIEPAALMTRLMTGGWSTAQEAGAIAGRGVGLDVIREAAERLGGTARFESRRGAGTTMTLSVPVTMAAVAGVVFESAGEVAVVPIEAVREAMRVGPGERGEAGEAPTIVYSGRAVPVASMAELLGGRARRGAAATLLVVGAGERVVALEVDRIVSTAEVVVRRLPAGAAAHPMVAGASLDDEGHPRLVLSPEALVAAALAAASAAGPRLVEGDGRGVGRVLVVDDSLTTRMLEQSILEAAGFEVDLAGSGEEGLERVRDRLRTGGRYVVVLVDVEMPGMDGYTFVERLKSDPRTAVLPAILVTSRGSAEDRRRGELAGADGYMVKSEFDQAALLRRIGDLRAAAGGDA